MALPRHDLKPLLGLFGRDQFTVVLKEHGGGVPHFEADLCGVLDFREAVAPEAVAQGVGFPCNTRRFGTAPDAFSEGEECHRAGSFLVREEPGLQTGQYRDETALLRLRDFA